MYGHATRVANFGYLQQLATRYIMQNINERKVQKDANTC